MTETGFFALHERDVGLGLLQWETVAEEGDQALYARPLLNGLVEDDIITEYDYLLAAKIVIEMPSLQRHDPAQHTCMQSGSTTGSWTRHRCSVLGTFLGTAAGPPRSVGTTEQATQCKSVKNHAQHPTEDEAHLQLRAGEVS